MKSSFIQFVLASSFLLMTSLVWGQSSVAQETGLTEKFNQEDKFRQLEEILPTPNSARAGSGAPGSGYWQQKVDYEIDVRLDDENQQLFGSEKITYTNNSKDKLTYLWLQLDANIHTPDSDANLIATTDELARLGFRQMKSMLAKQVFDGGFKITRCEDASTKKGLDHTIVKTMMRVDLPAPLEPGQSFKFEIDWNYRINNARVIRWSERMRIFRRGRKLYLRNGPVVPSTLCLHRQYRLATQTVSRSWRIYAGDGRLRRANHCTQRSYCRRDRNAVQSGAGLDGSATGTLRRGEDRRQVRCLS